MIKRAKKNSSNRSGTRGMYRTKNQLALSGVSCALNSNSQHRWLSNPGWSYSGVGESEKIDTLKTVLG